MFKNLRTILSPDKLQYLSSHKPEIFVFYTTLLFYFLLWLFNPGNKPVLAAFIVLIFGYNLFLKNIRYSILIAYLASWIVFTGKTYQIQLLPPGIFPPDLYPSGYVLSLVVTPKYILAFLMSIFLVRDLFRGRLDHIKIGWTDLLLSLFYFWIVLSDLFSSKQPMISLLFSLTAFDVLVLYFFLKAYASQFTNVRKLLFWLMISLTLFESVIAILQFSSGSPVYKNLESQVEIESFGKSPDEMEFRFRPVGTFQHANILAAWLSFWLLFIFCSLFAAPSISIFSLFILGLIVLALSLSRGAWLGFFLGTGFSLYVIEKRNKILFPAIYYKYFKILPLVALVIGIFFIIPRIESTIYSFGETEGGGYLRYAQIENSLALIKEHPLLGVGAAMNVQESLAFDPQSIFAKVPLAVHNWYILKAVESGIPALGLFISFVLLSIKPITKRIFNRKIKNAADFFNIGILSGLIVLFIVGFFQPFIAEELIILMLGVLAVDKYYVYESTYRKI